MTDFFMDGKMYCLPQIQIHDEVMKIIYRDELNKERFSKFVNFEIDHRLDYFKETITVDMSKEIVTTGGNNNFEISKETMTKFIENPDKYYLEFHMTYREDLLRKVLIDYKLIGEDELTEYDIIINDGSIGLITSIDTDCPYVNFVYWINVVPKNNPDKMRPIKREGSILLSKLLVSDTIKIVKYLR